MTPQSAEKVAVTVLVLIQVVLILVTAEVMVATELVLMLVVELVVILVAVETITKTVTAVVARVEETTLQLMVGQLVEVPDLGVRAPLAHIIRSGQDGAALEEKMVGLVSKLPHLEAHLKQEAETGAVVLVVLVIMLI